MTGEIYGALRKCTILERTMTSNRRRGQNCVSRWGGSLRGPRWTASPSFRRAHAAVDGPAQGRSVRLVPLGFIDRARGARDACRRGAMFTWWARRIFVVSMRRPSRLAEVKQRWKTRMRRHLGWPLSAGGCIGRKRHGSNAAPWSPSCEAFSRPRQNRSARHWKGRASASLRFLSIHPARSRASPFCREVSAAGC